MSPFIGQRGYFPTQHTIFSPVYQSQDPNKQFPGSFPVQSSAPKPDTLLSVSEEREPSTQEPVNNFPPERQNSQTEWQGTPTLPETPADWQAQAEVLLRRYGPSLLKQFGPPLARKAGTPLIRRFGPPLARKVGMPIARRFGEKLVLPLAKRAGLALVRRIGLPF